MLALSVLALLTAAIAAPAAGQSLEARRRTLEALNQQEDALESALGASRNQLARLLGALELFSRDPPPPLLVSPSSARDAVTAMILSQAIVPELRARARALADRAQALALVRRQAAEASGDLFAQESALEDRQGRLDAVAEDAALLAPPGARTAARALDGLPAPASLAPPADGAPSILFGGRLASGLRAQGLAYRTGAGAPVRSPADAVVAYAGPLNGWGQVVILRAGGDCHMVLSGLGKVTVVAGQQVPAAFPVGEMPTTGRPPPELYFEVRMGGAPIDPSRLIGAGRLTVGPDSVGAGANFNATGLRLRREGVD
jgi:septal ring factor EnvC (AmiA/AmiB activator)